MNKTNFENIDSVFQKADNIEAQQYIEDSGVADNEHVTAEEWNKVGAALKQTQQAVNAIEENEVRGIKQNNVVYSPDANGIINLPSAETSVQIISELNASEQITSITGELTLNLRFLTIRNNADQGNILDVVIERLENNEWKVKKTFTQPSLSQFSTEYSSVDITDVLSEGENSIRITATDSKTGGEGSIIFSKIVFTTLAIIPVMSWELPLTSATNGYPLQYAVRGTGLSKTIHITIDGGTEKTYIIGTNTYPSGNPWQPSYAVTTPWTHGVHTIEAWVTSGEYSSAHVKNQVMVVTDETDMTPKLMMQEVTSICDNYVMVDPFFRYAVYKPSEEKYKLTFAISNFAGTKTYYQMDAEPSSGTKYDVPVTVQIADAILNENQYAYLTAKSNGTNAITGGVNYAITVRNEQDFAPTSGAEIYVNPETRTNASNPDKILNEAANNAEISSVFEGFAFDETDGWLQSDDGKRVLRIPSGRKLTINKDIFAGLTNMSFEIDMKVYNVTNENVPVIDIANDTTNGKFVGIRMNALEGAVMSTSANVYGNQNFNWQEDVKTHIVVNINKEVQADYNSQSTIPLARVFINGSPDREFICKLQSGEWGDGTKVIKIGCDGADIDIYAIRVYTKAMSAIQVMQNVKSCLPTAAERVAFAKANDILGEDGTISYTVAAKKYSCIVHHGTPPSLQHPDAANCWLHIDHFVDGVYDNATSGDICKGTGYLPVKGQGSTAMGYADWNQQYDVKKAVLNDKDNKTQYIEKIEDDGSITRLPAIMVNGELKQDGWIDGNGNYKGVYYQLSTSDAKAQKLVGKINYASCMQSHKMGATNAYNDLYRKVLGDNLDTIMKADSKARCAVKEDWFLFFVQETETSTPRYEGIMTFGPGKMDKPTWGSKNYTDFAMYEGKDNDVPLANFEVPWVDDEVTYNVKDEVFMYNDKKSLDFSSGATVVNADGKEVPDMSNPGNLAMKDFVNFAFLHSTNIKVFSGSYESLIEQKANLDIHAQYWVAASSSAHAQGDLFRYCYLTQTWVNASTTKVNGSWAVRNILTERGVTFDADLSKTNNAIMAAQTKHFYDNAANYMNVESAKFHSCFVQNLLAGSDNCAKNTYYVADPVTHKICFHADDLDTIFKTDNKGKPTKPYYITREFPMDEDQNPCYSGSDNVLFNTMDKAYRDEYPVMMYNIFAAMADLVKDSSGNGSVDGFFDKYFFNIQKSIPCICYLEQARVRYEIRQIQVNNGIISPTVTPITQQMGSQLQAEKEYMKKRLVMFESYAAYGYYKSGGGGNNLAFRSYEHTGENASPSEIKFTLKPYQYIYPTGYYGGSTIAPGVRLSPNDTYEFVIEEASNSDSQAGLCAIDYYQDIGNIGELDVNPNDDISIPGKRLKKLIITPVTSAEGKFKPANMAVNAQMLEEIKINVAGNATYLDLSKQTRAKSIDLEDTSYTTIILPKSSALKSAKLPDGLSKIDAVGLTGLETYTLQGVSQVTEVNVDGSSNEITAYIIGLIGNLYNTTTA